MMAVKTGGRRGAAGVLLLPVRLQNIASARRPGCGAAPSKHLDQLLSRYEYPTNGQRWSSRSTRMSFSQDGKNELDRSRSQRQPAGRTGVHLSKNDLCLSRQLKEPSTIWWKNKWMKYSFIIFSPSHPSTPPRSKFVDFIFRHIASNETLIKCSDYGPIFSTKPSNSRLATRQQKLHSNRSCLDLVS